MPLRAVALPGKSRDVVLRHSHLVRPMMRRNVLRAQHVCALQSRRGLRDQLLDHFAAKLGELLEAAAVEVRELVVVEAEEPQ